MRWERGRWSTVGVFEAVAERCVSASAECALHEEANRSVRVLQKNDSSGSCDTATLIVWVFVDSHESTLNRLRFVRFATT